MKRKYIVIAPVVIGMAATLLAADKQPAAGDRTRVIHLKSGGKTIAELKILQGTRWNVGVGNGTLRWTKTGAISASGNVTISIVTEEDPQLTVKCAEMEEVLGKQ